MALIFLNGKVLCVSFIPMYIKDKPDNFMISDIFVCQPGVMLAVIGEHSHNWMCFTQCE